MQTCPTSDVPEKRQSPPEIAVPLDIHPARQAVYNASAAELKAKIRTLLSVNEHGTTSPAANTENIHSSQSGGTSGGPRNSTPPKKKAVPVEDVEDDAGKFSGALNKYPMFRFAGGRPE